MSGICMHISSDIEVYWPIYENFDKFLSIYVAQFATTNFHIQVKLRFEVQAYLIELFPIILLDDWFFFCEITFIANAMQCEKYS